MVGQRRPEMRSVLASAEASTRAFALHAVDGAPGMVSSRGDQI